jgi:hypothetical protein
MAVNQASVQSRGSARSVDCARRGIAQNPQSFPGEVARESAMMSPTIPIWSRSAFQDDFARHSGMISPG